MTKVLVPIAQGTEELEVVTIVDVLRRANIDVKLASIMPDYKVHTARDVEITADCHINYCEDREWDMVVIPGGMPGTQTMADNTMLMRIVKNQMRYNKWVAAICAAPALVLAKQGLISGKSATCYPSFRPQMEEAHVHFMNEPVVVCDKLITAQGPASALLFALKIVSVLEGDVLAKQLARDLLVIT